MICCKACGRMANGKLDTCPFCQKPLEIAALTPPATSVAPVGGNRMSLEGDNQSLDKLIKQPKQSRFSNPKVVDLQEWVAGRRKL